MTIEIKVTVPEGLVTDGIGADYLDSAMSALGFRRAFGGPRPTYAGKPEVELEAPPVPDLMAMEPSATEDALRVHQGGEEAPEPDLDEHPAGAPGRVFGSAPDGKKRRTKAELAEDEEIAALAEQTGAAIQPGSVASAVLAELRAKAGVETPLNISATPEQRVDPTAPEDAAQDAADEAAEAAAHADGLTLDNLRQAVGLYQKAHGFEQALARIPEILGGPVTSVAPERLADAIRAVLAAVAADGGAVAAEPAPTATKEEAARAAFAYGKAFDGADLAPAQMKSLIEDCPKIFSSVFGPAVTGLSQISSPEDYGKAVAAFEAAVRDNPYGRTRK